MGHDLRLRAAARAIYDEVYLSARCPFDEAERYATADYRQTVGAAQHARAILYDRSVQLELAVVR